MIHGLDNCYIPRDKRKKILLISDDCRMSSGVAGVSRDIIIGTSMHYNWVQIAGAIQHPDIGKKIDLNHDTNNMVGINDSSVVLYPANGYGDQKFIRYILKNEKPDVMMIITDPRHFYWLFDMEYEIRKQVPLIYLNIWDNLPFPYYNKPFYESCDALFAISKQTKNINEVVLGDKKEGKIIKYVPHGVDEKTFFPIQEPNIEYNQFKKALLNNKEYDFILFWNSRNIRRKSTPDVMLAWKIFIDNLPEDKQHKCALILHTQPVDENGTDLFAVKDMLFGNNSQYNVIFSEHKLPSHQMNYLYNLSDGVILISSNEGWGLSLTEAMMSGKMIIANVTGGMQDQMKFVDKHNNWIEFDEEFQSNHRGKYKKCGEWALPVFPSNISLVGSVPTPYIFDDRVDPHDVSNKIMELYNLSSEERKKKGLKAREWVTSDESMMSARWMSKNIMNGINKTLSIWKPRDRYCVDKIDLPVQPKHYVKNPISL